MPQRSRTSCRLKAGREISNWIFRRRSRGATTALIDAEKSDLFDVLEYVSFAVKPITRETRVANAQSRIFALLDNKQKEFLEFVLPKYVESGVGELDQEKLPSLLELKYNTISDAAEILGGVENIRKTFIDFQQHLYDYSMAA